jgi:hypothetical protein
MGLLSFFTREKKEKLNEGLSKTREGFFFKAGQNHFGQAEN